MRLKTYVVIGTLDENAMLLLGANVVLWCLVIGFSFMSGS